jgi:hypothetical protein
MQILRERKQKAERNPDEEEVRRDFMGISEETDDQLRRANSSSSSSHAKKSNGVGAAAAGSAPFDANMFKFDGHDDDNDDDDDDDSTIGEES